MNSELLDKINSIIELKHDHVYYLTVKGVSIYELTEMAEELNAFLPNDIKVLVADEKFEIKEEVSE